MKAKFKVKSIEQSAGQEPGNLYAWVNLVPRFRKNKFKELSPFYSRDKGGGNFATELKIDIIDKEDGDKRILRTSIWMDTEGTYRLLEDLISTICRIRFGRSRKSWSLDLPELSSKEDLEKITKILQDKLDKMEKNNEIEASLDE